MIKKISTSILIFFATTNIASASSYIFKIDGEKSAINETIYRDWQSTTSIYSDWVNVNSPYNYSEYLPIISIQENDFIQTRTNKQDQEKTEQQRLFDTNKKEYKNIGELIINEQTIIEKENRTILVNIGDWEDNDISFDCNDWSPLAINYNKGTSFTQSRNCSQNKIRLWTYMHNLTKIGERKEISNEVDSITETKQSIGTMLPRMDLHLSTRFTTYDRDEVVYSNLSGISSGYPNVIFGFDFNFDPNPEDMTFIVESPCGKTYHMNGSESFPKYNIPANCNLNGSWKITTRTIMNNSGTGTVYLYLGYN